MLPTLIDSVRDALGRRIPMVLYSLPGEVTEYTFFHAAAGKRLVDESVDFGFFYAPFESDGSPRLMVPATHPVDTVVGSVQLPSPTPRAKYIRDVADIAAIHATMKGGKTVYARRIAECGVPVDWSRVADSYFSRLPHTFRFLFSTPSDGCWLGASPELLLQRVAGSDIVSTMALAGTLRDKTSAWDFKNREEHDYVTRFILDTMRSFGMEPEVGPAEDICFGPVRHLCHRITARYSGPLIPLIEALSPTPALSGFPRDNAVGLIRCKEGDRSLYGGYVGVNSPGGIYAYVNLRSMCFNPEGGYCIYSGGGITAHSDPADEWLETESKSRWLCECITDKILV